MLKTDNTSPWIKICGFTQPENALECIQFGPDAIGLVFFEKSPRNVTIDEAARITEVLPEHIIPVGVFVDKSDNEILDIVQGCGLKGVQLHGSEPPDLVERLRSRNLVVIKALFAGKKPFLDQAGIYEMASFLLVEYGKGILPGGNAESWNYEISRQIESDVPILLAGGLSPENISGAISAARPAGVDVSSGVEKSPGLKDPARVKTFIENVRGVT